MDNYKPNQVYIGLPTIIQCLSAEDAILVSLKVNELRQCLAQLGVQL